MKIEILQGDITEVECDAIVNAANTSLLGGGGVDGAIHRKGGPDILEACREIRVRQGGCSTGEAVITTAGKLRARYVIHTVGPVWQGGGAGEAQLLADCYLNSLALAEEHACESVAFPNVSTGVYRYPKDLAARIAIDAVREHGAGGPHVERVVFVCFDAKNFSHYRKWLED